MLGVSLSDVLRHGSGFRLAPGDQVVPGHLATFEPYALEKRWYASATCRWFGGFVPEPQATKVNVRLARASATRR